MQSARRTPSLQTCVGATGCYPGGQLMNVDDIISYHDLVNAEKAALQKGMNFGIGKHYSVFLMTSVALIQGSSICVVALRR